VADRVAFLAALAAAQRGERGELEIRFRISAPGRPGALFRCFMVEFGAGDAAGEARLMLRDMAPVIEMREKVRQALEHVASTEVAKSRFLAAVSHELRTPLNSIIGFSDMLVHGMAGEFADKRQREYVELIRESGTHLLSVVNAILDVSKIEAGAYSIRPEPFVVAEAIELCRSMMAQQAHDKGVRLTAEVAPGAGEICADRRAVQQIMLNLLSNAVKFTPAGGEVAIEVQRRGSRLRLAVRDTGIGIAEEDLGRLGQPFMQVRNDFTRQFDGTGLGLSLVKGLVRLHEGEMTIESAPGEGTTVVVTLPVAGPAAAQPRQRPALVAGVDIGGFDEEFRKTA
jgi:cell cycle sensor histidine kinase DivJ